MPIMAAHGQNDARVAARLLASTAVDCLRDPASASRWDVALNNVYRLLEAFRLNQFFGLEAPTRRSAHEPEALAFQPMERHVKEVSLAIDQAIGASFVGTTREEAISEIESVLRGIAYPARYDRPSEAQLGKATQFFQEVLNRLKFV